MFTVPIGKIEEKDLQRLVDNATPESKTIEYKGSLNVNTKSDKKEFLADISSFANTIGGHIFYGVREDKGDPAEICGIDITSTDDLKLTIESLIRDGLEPRINYEPRFVLLQNGKYVIAIYIKESWNKPHMVTIAGHRKFYARSNSGKYPLSVDELRNIFIYNQSLAQGIRKFRFERISNIIDGETPVPCETKDKFILHIIPQQSLSGNINRICLSKLDSCDFNPIGRGHFHSNKINADGYVRYRYQGNNSNSYVQIFRNGIIECVSEALLTLGTPHKSYFTIKNIELEIKDHFNDFIDFLKNNEFSPPIFCFITVAGVLGASSPPDIYGFTNENTIEKDVLMPEECVMNSYDDNILLVFKPIFDALWNALGEYGTPNIDNDGNWKG